MSCNTCPLKNKVVPSSLPTAEYKLAIVGEEPAKQEIRQGKPFVGPSGKLLWEVLESVDIKRENCLVTNAVLCAGGKDNFRQCSTRLVEELKGAPKILAVGATAIKSLSQSDISILKARFTALTLNDSPIYSTYHPAFILQYAPDLYTDFMLDIERMSNDMHPKPVSLSLHHIDTLNELKDLHKELPKAISVDIETTHTDPHRGIIRCVGIGWEGKNAAILDTEANPDMMPFIQELLGRRAQIYQGGWFDVNWLRHYGVPQAKIYGDTLILSYALDERAGGSDNDEDQGTKLGVHGLKTLGGAYLGYQDYSLDIAPYIISGDYSNIPAKELHKYCAADVVVTLELYDELIARADDDEMRVYNMLIESLPALINMQQRGILVDAERANVERIKLESAQDTLLKEIEGLTHKGFNPSSPKQVNKALGIASISQNKYAVRQRKSNMKKLIDHDEDGLAAKVSTYRSQRSFVTTHLVNPVKLRDKEGAVHPVPQPHGTVTGRITYREPNILNVPRGSTVRSIYMAREGYTLISADYSQHEFRVAAVLSDDPVLIAAYQEGVDFHSLTADRLFPKTDDKDEQRENRIIAKAVNFGLLYTLGVAGLAEAINLPQHEAQDIFDTFKTSYPHLSQWIEDTKALVVKQHFVQSHFGRRRRFPCLVSSNVAAAQRMAVNMPVSSAAADITLAALVEVDKVLTTGNAGMVIFVYDSLTMECRKEYVDTGEALLKAKMLEAPIVHFSNKIPWQVDVKIGDRWS